MKKSKSEYKVGDRVWVETHGGTLPCGKYTETVISMRFCPDREAQFYEIKLDEGCGVSSFGASMSLLEDKASGRKG